MVDSQTTDEKILVTFVTKSVARRTATGIALVPHQVDAHGDIIDDEEVILNAAEDFLAGINVYTGMGLEHKDMNPPIDLVQSFVVPDSDMVINKTVVKKGSWVVTVRINDDDLWKDVLEGKYTGFSIGGKATAVVLDQNAT